MKRPVSRPTESEPLFLPMIGNDLLSLAHAILTTSDALIEIPLFAACIQ